MHTAFWPEAFRTEDRTAEALCPVAFNVILHRCAGDGRAYEDVKRASALANLALLDIPPVVLARPFYDSCLDSPGEVARSKELEPGEDGRKVCQDKALVRVNLKWCHVHVGTWYKLVAAPSERI